METKGSTVHWLDVEDDLERIVLEFTDEPKSVGRGRYFFLKPEQ